MQRPSVGEFDMAKELEVHRGQVTWKGGVTWAEESRELTGPQPG